jgi:hypothetical protein
MELWHAGSACYRATRTNANANPDTVMIANDTPIIAPSRRRTFPGSMSRLWKKSKIAASPDNNRRLAGGMAHSSRVHAACDRSKPVVTPILHGSPVSIFEAPTGAAKVITSKTAKPIAFGANSRLGGFIRSSEEVNVRVVDLAKDPCRLGSLSSGILVLWDLCRLGSLSSGILVVGIRVVRDPSRTGSLARSTTDARRLFLLSVGR